MKRILMALAIGMATLAVAQDKPRVFVAGKGDAERVHQRQQRRQSLV
jgi:hypothetical protein